MNIVLYFEVWLLKVTNIFREIVINVDCTESYSVNQNDEAPALRDPNDKSFVFVRMGASWG